MKLFFLFFYFLIFFFILTETIFDGVNGVKVSKTNSPFITHYILLPYIITILIIKYMLFIYLARFFDTYLTPLKLIIKNNLYKVIIFRYTKKECLRARTKKSKKS